VTTRRRTSESRGVWTTEFWAGLALPTVVVLLSSRLGLDSDLVKEWLWIPLAYIGGRAGVKMMLQSRRNRDDDRWDWDRSRDEYDVR
jgi:hypothetical protein